MSPSDAVLARSRTLSANSVSGLASFIVARNANWTLFHIAKRKAAAVPTAPRKAPRKTKEDHPPPGHTTADDAGESEMEITDAPPSPPRKKKKEEERVMLNLPARARVPARPEDVSRPVAGPSRVREVDGEVARLRAENARLREENAMLRESEERRRASSYARSACGVAFDEQQVLFLGRRVVQRGEGLG